MVLNSLIFPFRLMVLEKLFFVILFCGLASCQQQKQEATLSKPNIIVILADDLGYGDPEVYNDESKIPTPHINDLAANGILFTDAHSPSSVCTPTRYGILTGRYAWRTPLKKSVLWMWDKPLIETERETMPKMLKTEGYNTACIGKWHLGWRWPGKKDGYMNDTIAIGDYNLKGRNELWQGIDFSKTLGGGPLDAGFDYYYGDDVPNFAPYAFIENNKLIKIPDTLKPQGMYGAPGPLVSGWDLTNVMPTITNKAVTYIEEQGKKEAPFFLYFALTAPHTPIAPSSEFIGKSKAGRYGDYVNQVDFTVGQIIKTLKRTGQLENTLVVFTSDNGSPQRNGEKMGGKSGSVKNYGHDPSRPLKGIKSDIWEGGHRVPCIVSWPSKIKGGQINHQLFGLNDLMATFSGLMNTPNEDKTYEDSMDFSKVLLGSSQEIVRQDLVLHSIQGMFSIRKGPWKLIVGQGSGGWSSNPDQKPGVELPKGQLYNLEMDLEERNNVYNENPKVVAELTALLTKYQDQGFSNPTFN